MSALPLDILDLIARLLQHNPAALKAACLVARPFQFAFQAVLFSNVQINNETSLNKFLAVIYDQPLFASFVRSLELFFTRGSIGTIFVKLPLLRSLAIRDRRVLPPELCIALGVALGSQHLTSFTLWGVQEFPLQVLHEASALQHFSSIGTSYHGQEKALTNTNGDQIQKRASPRSLLRTLSLSYMGSDNHELLKWLTHPGCTVDIRGVKRLVFYVDLELDHNIFCNFLSVIPPTLEHLTFRAPRLISTTSIWLEQSKDFPLARFTHLRTMTIFTYIKTTEVYTEIDLLPWCHAFLSTLSTPSTVESLEIQCTWTFMPVTWPRSHPDTARRQRWNDFDGLLSSTAFPSLGEISLHLDLREGRLEEVKNAITRNLPRLEQQGKLRILAMLS
ncbi:hypothetical protein BDN72DRAFT_839460 [Pluteus cervinus]|uniref:Uncharacterized protein n=1 Tax=Pluteus cervinus TaxID=181527 RepID=A0ACD3AVW8_9AGAR|nr:hypothetical protein BDN72DRAFT_839460 [Pluteus cervinus]